MTESRSHSLTAAEEQQEGASVKTKSRSQSPHEEQPNNLMLEVDDAHDADSALSIAAPSLDSLRSSVLEYQQENGRTYHSMSSGKYAWPNDEAEVERLEVQHNVWLLTLRGEMGLCPKVDDAKRVLDVGTGSGVWAIDYADTHPEAEVIGVDLSPIQPSLVPPNCSFEVDDLEKDWTWSKPFDFIMSRVMAGSFSSYEAFIEKSYEFHAYGCDSALEPGGYLEFQDICPPLASDDGTMTPDTAMHRLGELLVQSSVALGRPLDAAKNYRDMMEKVGFVDVVERQFKWPVGVWPKDTYYKELGHWSYTNVDIGIEAMVIAPLTRGMGWSREEVLVFCAHVRADLRDPRIHCYMPIYVVYGKKPGTTAV